MKKSNARRFLSLLLALSLALSLAPTALLEGEEVPSGVTGIVLSGQGFHDNAITMERSGGDGYRLEVTLEPEAVNTPDTRVIWSSADESIATVRDTDNGHVGYIVGVSPGETEVTVKAGDIERKIKVTVSGIVLKTTSLTIPQNTSSSIKEGTDYLLYGRAADASGTAGDGNASITASSDKQDTVRVVSSGEKGTFLIDGVKEGRATVTITVMVGSTPYTASLPVEVTANEAESIAATASASKPLKFSTLEQLINQQCQEMVQGDDNTLASITGLSVSTDEGTLYLGYTSSEDTGAGVGAPRPDDIRSAPPGPYITDITVVPHATKAGATAVISFTGTAVNERTFKGKIRVTLEEAETDITINAEHGNPVKLPGNLFSEACYRETGTPLSYVIFTLPSANQGVLYRDYKSELDYAAKISSGEQYSQNQLNDITFVPAQGFVGTVHIGYAGYSVSGNKFTGELVVNVTQGLDVNITYNDDGRGRISFRAGDFDSFCTNATGSRVSYVSFTPPPVSQGKLYYGGRDITVTEGTNYYYWGEPSISNVSFVAADGFHGTVRIPFTGCDVNGQTFGGTVELHFQSKGAGDISYPCTAGSSARLDAADFNEMSLEMTGQRLHYVTFQTLPDFTQGSLHHNRTSAGAIGTRVTTSSKYYNSAAPYLSNVSFWATDSFRGTVEIPFTGCAVTGETFTGLLVIGGSGGNGNGSTNSGSGTRTVSYSTTGRQTVTFASEDFNSVCVSATNSALNYLRLSLPASSQGILYFNYLPGEASEALSETENLHLAGERSVSKVTFLPAYGFSGTVEIPFTAWAISGAQVQGTVEISVRSTGAMGTTVQYATYGSPVSFNSYDFQAAAGGNQPVSIRLTELPDASTGKLYYQYISPTKYSWEANTTTDYRLNSDPMISNLTFVPKAGYLGVANIPYTATNSDGSTYSGQIRVTMEASYASAQFRDLDGLPAQTVAAVDFLRGQGVVNGMTATEYGPDQPIRRGDFCLMLCRAFQFDASSGSARFFRDVPSNVYYAEAVNILSALGIVNGTGNNYFQPNTSISRQDAALMVQRTLQAANMPAENGTAQQLNAFADGGQVSGYAQGAVSGLVQMGLFPTIGNRIAPQEALTRADMAVLLHRTMTR